MTHFTKELKACTDDIKTWMTENQLKLNDDKTALLFPSSLKPSTVSLLDSITLGSQNIPFSDSARNVGLILDSKLLMKKHVIKSCTVKLPISSLNALVQSTGFSLKMQPRLLLLLISSHGSETTATVSSWVHPILPSNISRKFKTLLQHSFSWAPRHQLTLNTFPEKLHWLPISERIEYKVACMCFSAINDSGSAYLSELQHVYTPSRTLLSSSDTRTLKIQQYKPRLVDFAPSLALDPTFGIHSHKTLDTAQPRHLLKPS